MEKIAQFGTINIPPGVNKFGGVTQGGITKFLGNILNTLVAIAAIYAFFNLITAGYAFISAGDDPKKIESAWAKISQTLVGLGLAAGFVAIGIVIGWIFFDSPDAIFQFRIFGP